MSEMKSNVENEIRRRTRTSFFVFFVCLALGGLWFAWLYNQPQDADGVQPTLRKGLEANDKLFSLFYSKRREAKHFDRSAAVEKVRVNGDAGMEGELDTATWRLKVARAPGDTLTLTLNDIKALP